MQKENAITISLKYIAIELIGNILYWPIWWYTKGFYQLLINIYTSIVEEEKRFGIKIWLVNLFNPMYAQYDWQGRIISFFMRLVMLIFKIILFLVWLLLMILVVIGWLVLPLFAVYMIIRNLFYFFE